MGFGTEAPKNGLRRHLGVSRHRLGEDTSQNEDTWASEDTFSEHCPGQDTSESGATQESEDICQRKVGRRHVLSRRQTGVQKHVPKTGVVAKTHGCAKTNSKLPKQLEFPKSEPQTSIPRDKPPSLNMGTRLKKVQ